MTYSELRDLFRQTLAPLYPPEELRAIFHLYVESRYELLPVFLYLNLNSPLPPVGHPMEDLQRLADGEPIQYVLGTATFCDMELHVDPAVLIPRPETAELVNKIAHENTGRRKVKILDLGTGSGAIAIALARALHGSEVWACDISESALKTARLNAETQNAGITFFQWDMLTGIPPQLHDFDILVSNPPYIPENEKSSMHCNVTAHEPATALFVPDDNPLIFYQRICEIGQAVLRFGGKIHVEIHEAFARETVALFQQMQYQNVEVIQDLNGKDRIVTGEL